MGVRVQILYEYNPFRLVLYPNTCSNLERVPPAFEKNVYTAVLQDDNILFNLVDFWYHSGLLFLCWSAAYLSYSFSFSFLKHQKLPISSFRSVNFCINGVDRCVCAYDDYVLTHWFVSFSVHIGLCFVHARQVFCTQLQPQSYAHPYHHELFFCTFSYILNTWFWAALNPYFSSRRC